MQESRMGLYAHRDALARIGPHLDMATPDAVPQRTAATEG
jgi:hypothetical protein